MASQLTSVSLWVRAFIPAVVLKADGTESSATITSGPHVGKKVIPGPFGVLWFHTDDRTYSSDKAASSRAHCEVIVDFTTSQVSLVSNRCDPSLMFASLTDENPRSALGDPSRLVAKDITVTNEPQGGRVIAFTMRGEANNPLVPGSPDIDWDIRIIVEIDTGFAMGRITVRGLVDPFPAYEMYLATSAVTQPALVFSISPIPGSGPWNLIGNPTIAVEGASPIRMNFGKSLDGVWMSNDAPHRYQFTITGTDVVLVTRFHDGSSYSINTTLHREGGVYRIDRKNDEPTLRLMGYVDPELSELLAASPEPSFFIVKLQDDTLVVEWHNFSYIILNTHVAQFVQPSQAAPFSYVFIKQ